MWIRSTIEIMTKSWSIDFNAHGILNSLPMVYRPPYPIQLLTFNAVYSWLYGPGQWMIDRGRIVMSRLKLKVNNCLLNNKEFFKLFNSIFNKIGYNCFIISQDYLNIKMLKYDENFEILWNFCKFWNFINFEIYQIYQIIWKFWTLKKQKNIL
jgi:hypothetical protein